MPKRRDNFEPVSGGRDLNHRSGKPHVIGCRATGTQLRAFARAGTDSARDELAQCLPFGEAGASSQRDHDQETAPQERQ